jgi:type I restriction enzyme S subunit
LENFLIPLPPLAEQRAIAHVLRTVQWAKEATEGVIAALKELKKSLMQHLFTYGPVPVTERERVPLQETEIGPLPAHWRVVRLGEVAAIRAGVAFPHEYQGSVEGSYPFYKVSDMNTFGNEIYMEKASNWVNSEILRKLKAKLFPSETVIFPKVGGALLTNKKRLLARESLIDNNIMGVIVRQDICIPQFCFYWFESIDIRMFSNPGPLPSINAQGVKKSFIPLPPLDEQREIARILQAVDAKIAAEQARRAALEELFKSLLHELMSGQIRLSGDLTVHAEKENL